MIESHESIMSLEGSFFDDNPVMIDMSFPNSPETPRVNIFQQIEQWEQRLSRFNINPPPVLFHNQLPERSQSSLSFKKFNNSPHSITNKLGFQHGIVQTMRKLSRTEDTISITDTIKKRRSRSADSRFSQSLSVPYEASQKQTEDMGTMPSTSRRSRETMRYLSVPAPDPEIKIQVNGKGVDI